MKLKALVPLMKKSGEKMIAYMRKEMQKNPNTVFNGKELLIKYTTENFTSCIMGTEGKSFNGSKSELIEIIRGMLGASALQDIKILIIALLPSVAKFLNLR